MQTFILVAPLAGAWIEMFCEDWGVDWRLTVAPLAGAWIEMVAGFDLFYSVAVAPLAGAWIEIERNCAVILSNSRRPPCGGVD